MQALSRPRSDGEERKVKGQTYIFSDEAGFILTGALVNYMQAKVNLISILISFKESHLLSDHQHKDVCSQGKGPKGRPLIST